MIVGFTATMMFADALHARPTFTLLKTLKTIAAATDIALTVVFVAVAEGVLTTICAKAERGRTIVGTSVRLVAKAFTTTFAAADICRNAPAPTSEIGLLDMGPKLGIYHQHTMIMKPGPPGPPTPPVVPPPPPPPPQP